MSLTDIGVNFTSKKFDNVDEMIKDARDSGVDVIIGISNSVLDIPKNLSVCKRNEKVYCTAGVHPHQVRHLNDERFNNLRKYLVKNNDKDTKRYIVAIGECGLDYNRNFSTPEDQCKWFTKQLELAGKLSYPIYLHCRDAFDDFMMILDDCKYNFDGKAVVHCFTDGEKELTRYIDSGYYVGITGWICDNVRAKALISGLTALAKDRKQDILDRIMIETDSPWLYPKNIKGKRPKYNTPSNVTHVADKLADVLDVSREEIIKVSHQNCLKFFGLHDK